MNPGDYNCFAYAEAFITGAFPLGSDFTSLIPEQLYKQGFFRMGLSTKLENFPPAKIGDLVTVETATDQTRAPWDHVGIVIGVDLNGHITRIRQKWGSRAGECVIDTTAEQFQSADSLHAGEQYELWRNDSVDFLGKLAR
jgi:hypothetical protein